MTTTITDPRQVSRSLAVHLGRETVEVLNQGTLTIQNAPHNLHPAIEYSRTNTVYYPPNLDSLASWPSTQPENTYTTSIKIEELSTIDGALLLAQSSDSIGVLNFASAKHPGGGWLNGARAQEESLTRSSTLYSSLTTSVAEPFYALHNTDPQRGYYSHSIIYSPRVVFFRDMGGSFISPFEVKGIVTSPAVNAGTVRGKLSTAAEDPEPEIRRVMKERMARILYVFEINEVKDLVLGSFGTGAFKNRVDTVASIWAELLVSDGARFKNSFRSIVFAILGKDTIEKFREVFVGQS